MSGFKIKKTFGSDIRPAPTVNINVGCLMDVVTATVVTGAKGEKILNGGLPPVVMTAGPGNAFKSTFTHYLSLAAMNVICSTHDSFKHTYDTENNTKNEGLERLLKRHEFLKDIKVNSPDTKWTVTNKATTSGDDWIEKQVDFIKEKEKDKDYLIEFNALKDPRTNGVLKIPVPTFTDIDSLTEFESSATMDLLTDKGLDSSETNTLFLKQGLMKTKMFSMLPYLSLNSSTYFTLTAHVGEKKNLDAMSTKYAPPPRTSQYINTNTTVKGVTDKAFFLTNLSFYVKGSSALKNQSTKLAEYPKNSDDETETDLNVITVVINRNKSGNSGIILDIIVSQSEGVLPELTEFHFCKENNRFGIEGNNTSYNMALYPDVKIGRTTVRSKLETDYKLARAVGITAELLQVKKYLPQFAPIWCTPEVLYKDLKDKGYDWNILLDSRRWMAPDNYAKHLKPYLSVIDLLEMRAYNKIPFWYDKSLLKKEDKETNG